MHIGGGALGHHECLGSEMLKLIFNITVLEESRSLTTAATHFDKSTINHFCHIHQSPKRSYGKAGDDQA